MSKHTHGTRDWNTLKRRNTNNVDNNRKIRICTILLFLLLPAVSMLGVTLANREIGPPAPISNGALTAKPQIASLVAATNIREATGTNGASIQATVDAFRTDLGTLRPNTRSSFPNGRREINWDGVPDGSSAPNAFPPDFFNKNSPRGVVCSTPGTGFQVSMDDDTGSDPDPDQVRFDNLNATYSSQFNVFSAQRLFIAVGSNITDLTFFVPGTNIPATVTGFGTVFTDVDSGGSTNIQFFDPDGNLLLIQNVLATPGSQSLSFLGVSFTNGQRVSRVRITSGNSAPGPNDNPGAGVDVVAMDDFIYAEPQAAVCSPQTIVGDIGQGSANYPSTSGVQTGRVIQNGIDSTCASPKTCPGTATGGPFAFDAYQFANNSNAGVCVTFTFPTACGPNQAMHPVAYLGSFDSSNPCTNYLGDLGHSINAGESGAFSVNVPANSIVVLVVHEVGTAPDCSGYSFTVTGLPPCFQAQLPCPPQTIVGDIGQGSADYPSTSGVQINRVSNNGVDSTCAAPKSCPGIAPLGGTFAFDAYQFANNSSNTVCVTFTFPTSCGANQAIHPVAYLGSFDSGSPCTNYLGDMGHSINAGESGAFSVNLPANSIVVLVVHELGTAPDCSGYSFSISGLPPCQTGGVCTITCPANVTKASDPSQCGAVASYPPPTLQGQCGAIACNPPSGSFFPLGITTVTCTEGNSASTCSFSVTVVDNQPPMLACPANITAVTPQNVCPSPGCVLVNFPAPVATDCQGATVVCNPASGSCFPVGATSVTCTATDPSGNTASCSFSVTVFNVCLQDDSDPGAVLLFNSSTGDYRFCCAGTTLTGKGVVSTKGCLATLQHNPGDRRVMASVDRSLFRGIASLQTPPGTIKCNITDRDTRNNSCLCH